MRRRNSSASFVLIVMLIVFAVAGVWLWSNSGSPSENINNSNSAISNTNTSSNSIANMNNANSKTNTSVNENENTNEGANTNEEDTTTNTNKEVSSNTNANANQPISSGQESTSESGNIIVTSPSPNDAVTTPMTVSGRARVFENVVEVRLKTKSGITLIHETTTAKAPDTGQFGNFSLKITYEFTNTKEGFVDVYSLSAKDGTEQDLVSIPVTFN